MLAAIAIKNGLFEGGLWCDSDYGHVQVGISAEACAQSIYASAKKLVVALLSKKDETVVDEAKVFDYSLVSVANADEVKVEKVAARAHHRRVHYASRRRHRNGNLRGAQPPTTVRSLLWICLSTADVTSALSLCLRHARC